MPKPRNKENKPLPKRWTFYHGAYYYLVPKGMEYAWDGKTKFRLGKTLSESFKAFGARVTVNIGKIKTLNQAFDRYTLEVIPTKAPASQVSNFQQLKVLRAVFGEMPILPFAPKLVYMFVDKSASKTSAHRQIDTLSHVYTKLIEWGEIDQHPFKGQVRLEGEKPRERLIEEWELAEFLSLTVKTPKCGDAVIQAYVRIKSITGMDKGTMLRLEPSRQFKEDGIHIQRHKTKNSSGKRTIYTWTPALRDAVQAALDARPVHISPYLFCTKRGESYINEETGNPSGFKSLWQRYFKRVMAETNLKEHFTERDLRAMALSAASTLEQAQGMGSHSDPKITERIYRRKATVVMPLK